MVKSSRRLYYPSIRKYDRGLKRAMYSFVIIITIYALCFCYNFPINLSRSFFLPLQNSATLSPRGGPSDIQICRVVAKHSTSETMSTSVEDTVLVTEDGLICQDTTNPTTSLGQILAASYLAEQAAAHHGVKVKYHHNCGARDQSLSNIQQLIPPERPASSAMEQDDENFLSWQDLHYFCTSRLEKYKLMKGGQHDEHALFSWVGQDINRKQLIEYGMSFIQTSILSAIDTYDRTPLGDKTDEVRTSSGTAAIYIACEDEFCTDVRVLPHYLYLMHIPSSVKIIYLIVQRGCMDNFPSVCKFYTEGLMEVLQKGFPRTEISLFIQDPSSVLVFATLIRSDYIICGPTKSSGWSGATAYFLPMLANGRQVRGVNTRVVTFQDSIKETEYEDVKFPRLGKVLPMPQFEIFSLHEGSTNFGGLASFLKLPPPDGDCMYIRGKIGTWVEDLQYAQSAQYNSKLRHYSGQSDLLFKRAARQGKTGGKMFRPSSTYKWVEKFSAHLLGTQGQREEEGCAVNSITLDSFCSLLQTMNIRKILMLGDSLMLQQAQSLWKLLEQDDQPTELHTLEPNFTHHITCPNHIGSDNRLFQFKYQFVRNDRLVESNQPVSIDNNIMNCGNAFCYPWFEAYKTDADVRNLVIVNAGLHMIDADMFRARFHDFVETIDLLYQEKKSKNVLRKDRDILMFRTSTPGHFGCDVPGLKPFQDYKEYAKFIATDKQSQLDQYGWKMINEFNDEVATLVHSQRNMDWLSRRQVVSNNKNKLLIEILDIFPMTILRRDGHLGDEFKPDPIPAGDCLHYALPGPVDWWNHLLYSNLRDIFFQEK